ncbi:hypothetical protein AAKU64_001783 [Undibacterium sp. GrIS 1.8]|uniref:hypothetical protein n=1 Tax=unclassified Undibacterium TaxID=2630295 RepID=UPI0033961D72
MKKIIYIVSFMALTSSILCSPLLSQAQTTSTSKKATAKTNKIAEKLSPVKAVPDEDDLEPDITENKTFDYKCELGNFFTIYTNADDDKHVAIRWKKRLYRLSRIDTTTGANRFENKKAGFVFIGIPSKSMLLDSRHGQQLANECKTPDQVVAETERLSTASQAK